MEERNISGPTYCGEKPDLGRVVVGKQYPGEGYAILKCGNTEVQIGQTLLGNILLHIHGSSSFYGELRDLQKAFYSIACEAGMGRTGEPNAPTSGVLTKAELVDTLDCFWNAAIGDARHSDDYVVLKTVEAIAEGISAMANHLREGDA